MENIDENKNEIQELLPAPFKLPDLTLTCSPTQYLEASAGKAKLAVGRLKYSFEEALGLSWKAHEVIVRNHPAGWSWRRWCKEAGIAHTTPIRWFQKAGISYTITHRPTSGAFAPDEPAGENPSTVIVDEGIKEDQDEVPVIIPEVMPRDPKMTELDITDAIVRGDVPAEGKKRIIGVIKKSMPKKPKADKGESEAETEEELVQEFNDALLHLKQVYDKLTGNSLETAIKRMARWLAVKMDIITKK